MQKTANPLHQAVNYLARREHSIYELGQKLQLKGHDPETIEQTIRILQSRGYLDEKRYVETMLRHHISRGQGPQKIRYLLSQQHIDPVLVNELFAESDVDWFAAAAAAREKKFGLKALPEDGSSRYKERAKQMRFLLSRGFEQEQIQYAMECLGNP